MLAWKNIFTFSFIIIVLISNQITLGQNTLHGTYLLKQEEHVGYFESPSYVFRSDGSFELKNYTDVGLEIGFGKYFLNNTKLILMYEYYEQKQDTNKSQFEVENRGVSNYDSIKFKVLIANPVKDFFGGNCYLTDTSGKNLNDDSGSRIGWEASRLDGKLEFSVSRNFLPFRLKIILIGCYPAIIPIGDPLDKNITVILKFESSMPRVIHAGTIETFKIKNLSEYGFSIKRSNERGWNYYYKK
jgi:hypothetical protein